VQNVAVPDSGQDVRCKEAARRCNGGKISKKARLNATESMQICSND
jgi:hypothetical protein